MTKYTLATLDQWVLKTERRIEAVVKQSVNDAAVMATRTATGTTLGGSVKPGFVPRVSGFLAGSFVSSLNGSQVGKGEDSYTLVVGQMEVGDLAQFGWTAPYARKLHYDGWLWVDTMASQWPQIVDNNIVRAKAQVG